LLPESLFRRCKSKVTLYALASDGYDLTLPPGQLAHQIAASSLLDFARPNAPGRSGAEREKSCRRHCCWTRRTASSLPAALMILVAIRQATGFGAYSERTDLKRLLKLWQASQSQFSEYKDEGCIIA